MFLLRFPEIVAEAQDILQAFRRACEQVQSSGLLRCVLAACLHVGNELNQGTARGTPLFNPSFVLHRDSFAPLLASTEAVWIVPPRRQ